MLRGTQHNLLCMLVDTLTISFWALHSMFSNFLNWSAQILQNCEIGDSTYLQNSECVQYIRRECYDLQNMVGGGVIYAKYGGVEVRFAIYPSEKHLELVSTDFAKIVLRIFFCRFDFQHFDFQIICR